jgi:hypothetical protein
MTTHEQLAHQLAAGFLEQASAYAAKFGKDRLLNDMLKALSNLQTEYASSFAGEIGLLEADPQTARDAIILACEITKATLSADTRTIN